MPKRTAPTPSTLSAFGAVGGVIAGAFSGLVGKAAGVVVVAASCAGAARARYTVGTSAQQYKGAYEKYFMHHHSTIFVRLMNIVGVSKKRRTVPFQALQLCNIPCPAL